MTDINSRKVSATAREEVRGIDQLFDVKRAEMKSDERRQVYETRHAALVL